MAATDSDDEILANRIREAQSELNAHLAAAAKAGLRCQIAAMDDRWGHPVITIEILKML